MAFDTFDRLAQLRDPERLRSGTTADALLDSIKRLNGDKDSLSDDDRRLLYDDEQALRERKRLWSSIIASAGERYRNANLKSFEQLTTRHRKAVGLVRQYLEDFESEPLKGRNLLFIGPPGTGKDHLMMAVLRRVVHRFGLVTAWVDGQAWFGAVRDAYASEETETPLVNFACRSELFAISDPMPSNGAITEHQRNLLFRVIDGRYRKMGPTLATINVATRAELNDRLGDSLADRLCDNAVVVPCNWPSFRQKPKSQVAS